MSAGAKCGDGVEEEACTVMETSMVEEEESFFNPPTSSETGVSEAKSKHRLENLCRVCANTSDYFIPIFENEGIEHQLDMKIHQYLPIQLVDADGLPTHLCLQCASTLIAWHDLVTACVEADKRLHLLLQQEVNDGDYDDHEEKEIEFYDEPLVQSDEGEELSEPSTSAAVVSGKESLLPQKRTAGKGKQQRKAHENISSDSNAKRVAVPVASKEAATCLNEATAESAPAERCGHSVLASTKASVQNSMSQHKVSSSRRTPNGKGDPVKCLSLLSTRSSLEAKVKEMLEYSMSWHGDCDNKSEVKRDTVTKYVTTDIPQVETPINECVYCNKKFKSRMILENHVRTHTGELPFTCHICGKGFRANIRVVRHVRAVHKCVKNLECDICGRKFATNRNRSDHRRTHTGERPYVCAVCGKTFGTSAALYMHNKFHKDVFPFDCSFCEKKFRLRSHYNVHVRTHTGEKPYSCDVCGKRFNEKTKLKSHHCIYSGFESFVSTIGGNDFKDQRSLKNHESSCHEDF